jgi:hypothetical protein
MPLRLTFPIVAITLSLASPVLAAGSEPCQSDNRWCDGSRAQVAGRTRPVDYSNTPIDPDRSIRLQMLRDKIEDKAQ